jgi:hypothetical protein
VQPSAQQRLCEAFRFDTADLAANQSLRLSERQEARLRAASGGARLAFAIFAVLLGASAAVPAWMAAREGGAGAGAIAAAVAAGVVLAVGFFASRGSLAALRSRQVAIAEGTAQPAGADRIQIGSHVLRVAAAELLEPFDAGASYRVFYLAGPRALVLSAERLDAGRPGADLAAAAPLPAADPVLRRARRARWVLVGLALLAALAPLSGWAADRLRASQRALAILALAAGGLGFALFAARWLRRR